MHGAAVAGVEVLADLDEQVALEIFRLRVEAWASEGIMPNGSVSTGGLSDALDVGATHFVVRAAGKIVAAARITIHSTIDSLPESDCYLGAGPIEKLFETGTVACYSRQVVAPPFRGQRLSVALDDSCIPFGLARSTAKAIVCNAHERRAQSLRVRGFRDVATVRARVLAAPKVQVLDKSPHFVLALISREDG